jgi:FkbM family methyltransferase
VRIDELLPEFLADARRVVDLTPEMSELHQYLRVPDDVSRSRPTSAEAEALEPDPLSLLVGLLGPEASGSPAANGLARAMRLAGPGARAILLIGWPIDALPYDVLLGPFLDGWQILEAVPLEKPGTHGVHCALVMEQTDNGEMLVANEYLLRDLVARWSRRRLVQLEAANTGLDAALARAEAALTNFRASATYQIGHRLVTGMRHPGRGIAGLPRDLVRIWRSRSAKRGRSGSNTGATTVASTQPPKPTRPARTRVVPVVFPPRAAAGTTSELRLATMVAPTGLVVPRTLAERGLGGYEREALACFLAATDTAGPGAVLDIGANVGVYAALADAVTDRQVIGFEPTPFLVKLARSFGAENGFGYAMESLALGAENGVATFYLSDVSDSSNSLAEGFRASTTQIDVSVETLDSYLERTRLVPAVVKVDTESTEPDVLIGARRSIERHRPWILCEVLAGRTEERLTEILAPLDYHWYPITDQIPLLPADRIVGDSTYRHLMWMFAPEPPGDDFWAAMRRHEAALATCTVDRGVDMYLRQAALAKLVAR